MITLKLYYSLLHKVTGKRSFNTLLKIASFISHETRFNTKTYTKNQFYVVWFEKT